ncbi:SDR family NAD(P)-dependent oxidoreductase [Croceibacterium aestuarii]|uniref:SDR family NAD(P)-dependent oxidoreductase n=1 Tax=Croceibacterium aestuarii TaxID=3064139 RepID=UPI00272ED63B|nr:SDR family NAD(P)-dependent oxidoreductase [Croceibacterium sp. D39]
MAELEPTILIAGASRGLGLAMAEEFAGRGWHIIGTVRADRTGLHELSERLPGKVRVEQLDVTLPASIAGLREALSGQRVDAIFVNAGTTTSDPFGSLDQVTDADFLRVMETNALAPMRVVAALEDLLPPNGMVGAMSSGLGSIADNTMGKADAYRASKAALNMLMKTYAVRRENAARPVILMAPGWIKTELGGEGATFTLEETVPAIVDTIIAKRERPGLEYLDRFGQAVAW